MYTPAQQSWNKQKGVGVAEEVYVPTFEGLPLCWAFAEKPTNILKCKVDTYGLSQSLTGGLSYRGSDDVVIQGTWNHLICLYTWGYCNRGEGLIIWTSLPFVLSPN